MALESYVLRVITAAASMEYVYYMQSHPLRFG